MQILVTLATIAIGAATGAAADRAIVGASGAWRNPRVSRAIVVIVTSVGFGALTAWWWGSDAVVSVRTVCEFLALAWLLAISVALTVIDVRVHRLPDRIVLPTYPVAIALFAGAVIGGAGWADLGRALLGAAVLFAFYLVVRLTAPGAMGGGDVKLAGVLGLYLGWSGWSAVLVGSFAAFVLGGIVAAVLLLAGSATRRTAIPFGPWMISGTWIGLIAASVMWRT